ncbi:hypothetical protein [Halarchaeum salinum]|uniref:Small CPxCG-related zinc finger protein n=1 Tax=Halarchaeum salinum TaxID=489912 RepID=A0AAV3S806_9EURY
MSEREIRVCPVCRCADFETARGGFGSRETPTRHSCNCCGERFDEPATRPPKRDGGLRGDSLAAALDDADPDDLVTDGGRDVESSSATKLCEDCEERPVLTDLNRCVECLDDALPDTVNLPDDTRDRWERDVVAETERGEGGDAR